MAARELAEQTYFEAARKIPAGEAREAYLQRVCGDDAALRQRVRTLLQAHDEHTSFLEFPPAVLADLPSCDSPIKERLGSQIGPYKLLQQIGEGGMGVVFMAEQREPVERRVALKIIKPGMDTRQVVARFEAERQALSLMDHPNIARVLDAGTTVAGRPYFVMELVKGLPITQYCDEKHLPPRERLALFVQVCQAVQHAHQKGIIHRDLKPSNMMVAEYDDRAVPKIIDFGVAKACQHRLTERTVFTEYGQIIGTLEYMSPEQAKLNQLDIDTRSDVYSLGVLLYELLSGEPPFDRERLRSAAFDELLRIIREEDPPRPSVRLSSSHSMPAIAAKRQIEPKKLSALIRGDLDWIVMKAMEKDRTRRYETANGLACDIRRFLDDEPVVACPPSAGYRFRKFARRHRGILATLSAIGLVLCVASLVSSWQAIRAMRAEDRVRQLLVAEREAHGKAQRAEREARRQLFNAYVAQAKATRLSGRSGQRGDALKAIAKAVRLVDPLGLGEDARDELRSEAIASLELVDLRPVKTWQARQKLSQGDTTLSGDFQTLAFSDGDSIHVRRLDDPTADAARISIAKGPHEHLLRFDPTRRYLLRWQVTVPTVSVTELATGRDVLTAPAASRALTADFHPRAAQIAVGGQDGVVRCFDLVSGKEIRKFPAAATVWSLKYDPAGRHLAIGADQLQVHDLETGEVILSRPDLGGQAVLAWHPDGTWLAAGATPDIHVFEVNQPTRRQLILHGHQATVIRLQFDPQGQLLASASWDGTTRLWDAATAQQLLRVRGSLIGFSEDGRRLACLQGLEATVFEVVRPCAHRWLSKGMTAAVAVAADDRLAASSHDNGVRLWDLERLKQVAYLPIGLTSDVLFRAPAGQLVTSGNAGLYQWPIRRDSQGGAECVRIGPPQAIDASLKNMRWCHFSRDGNTLLAEPVLRDEAFVFQLGNAAPRRIRLSRPGLSLTALSPDGKWAAASSTTSGDVRIWNAASGEHVCDLPTVGPPQVCFSPDSRAVMTKCGAALQIWEVGTWKVRYELPLASDGASAIAFAPDGRLAAVGLWGSGMMLMDAQTQRRLAQLELAESPTGYVDLSYTSDGAWMLAAVDHSGCCAWDFRVLRERLADLGLDWRQPPLPKAETAHAQPPLQVEVDLGELAEKKSS